MTEGAAMVVGASSMIFWCRRWMEQSRPKREMALPYSSASTCTSRCRACCASFIRKTEEPGASACTCGGGKGCAPASSPPRIQPWTEAGPAVSPGGKRKPARVGAGPRCVPQEGMGTGMGLLGTSHLPEAGAKFLRCLHFSDAFSPAAFCCLDHQWVADPLGHLRRVKDWGH